ncbi:peptidase [Peribacillus cavernae]|uniref:Peptidase n=1 Tax=Peribacillus cavernae TaxID=1674310 RepID=A0A3S0U2D0_9BACI|nr:peptidase [Peribacillus cavernae]MDQ0217955.1 acetylornithine deacetylase [Peribacillus cavernae]RUQ32602.1 peptidase [Peribacillus cavernae]
MAHGHDIQQWLKQHRMKGIKLLQRLVQEPSRRGQEGKAQALMAETCRELGLSIDLWEIGDEKLRNHPNFYCDRTDFSGNPNLVAVKKGKGGGKSLILNGHIDVVPEGNLTDWQEDPFSGMVQDGKVFGRGTTDMKGGTVSLILALEAIISLEIELKGDVIFQSVIEEESGGAGTLAAVLRGYHADGAIIPEPTNMKLFPLQQGSMWFRLTIKGKSAHGGTRYEGVNAIELAMDVINEITKLEKERNDMLNHPLYKTIPIPIPINIGKISSGEWPSSVPDTAVIEGRFGIAPAETMEAAERALEDCIARLNTGNEWFQAKPIELELFGARWLPGNLELNHPLMQTISESFLAVKGKQPVIEAAPWGTDGGYLSNIGGIPVVVFGPGKTELAHDADEYIEIDKVIEAAEIIALSIINWCGTAEPAVYEGGTENET